METRVKTNCLSFDTHDEQTIYNIHNRLFATTPE